MTDYSQKEKSSAEISKGTQIEKLRFFNVFHDKIALIVSLLLEIAQSSDEILLEIKYFRGVSSLMTLRLVISKDLRSRFVSFDMKDML